jgi:hypothetical protein
MSTVEVKPFGKIYQLDIINQPNTWHAVAFASTTSIQGETHE